MSSCWLTTRFSIDLSRPRVMGIVNLTPDSFSDGGRYSGSLKNALEYAEKLLADGADILDIGGESTRPNAAPVAADEEWQRVAPLLEEISRWNVPVSLDTRRTATMRRALERGWADIINDVQALEDEGALELLAAHRAGVCLMHMKGQPENMQDNPQYRDVCTEVAAYLRGRADACRQAGIDGGRIVLDPGFGFGKTLEHNIALLHDLPRLQRETGLPILAGLSRKRMIGEITGRDLPAERAALILRVHDVRDTVDALKVWQRLR